MINLLCEFTVPEMLHSLQRSITILFVQAVGASSFSEGCIYKAYVESVLIN